MTSERTVLPKEERRAQLVEAASRVFAEKGYRSASITDIIEAAGVARGTFYLYFDSKLDAFHAVMDRFLDLFKEVVEREVRRPYGNPLQVRSQIRESLLEWLKFFRDHRELAKIAFREANAIEPDYEKRCVALMDSCFAHWRQTLERFQALGIVRKDLDPAFMNHVFSGVMIHVVVRYVLPNKDPNLDWIVDQWVALLESGVRAKGWLG